MTTIGASNADVIDTLKLEIDVSVSGLNDLKEFSSIIKSIKETLTGMSSMIDDFARSMRNYNNVVNTSSSGNASRGTTGLARITSGEYTGNGSTREPFNGGFVDDNFKRAADDFTDAVEDAAKDVKDVVNNLPAIHYSTIWDGYKSDPTYWGSYRNRMDNSPIEAGRVIKETPIKDNIPKHDPEYYKYAFEAYASVGRLYLGKATFEDYGMQDNATAMEKFADSVANAGKAVQKYFGGKLNNIKDNIKGFKKGIDNLIGSFKRILKYRIIRSIIKGIAEGFTTGVQNLARYSSAFNGVMSQFSTSTLYFKNSIGAAVKPLLESLIPALTQVINVVVKVIEWLNQLFTVMRGGKTYTRAKEYAVDYADSLDNANSKAKELKNTLMSFDEINRLDDNSSSSASSAQDYSQMFEEATVDSGVIDFWDKVRAAIPTDAVEHFKEAWERLKETVEKFGNSKAWETIKNGIAKIVGFSLGAIIEGFADLCDWVSALLDFFSDPSPEKFYNLLKKTVDLIFSFPDYVLLQFKASAVFENLPQWLQDFLNSSDSTFVLTLKAILKLSFPEIHIGDELKEKLKKAAKDALEGFFNGWKEQDGALKIFGGIIGWFQSLIESITGKDVLDEHSPSKVMYQIGAYFAEGFFNGISEKWESAKTTVLEKFSEFRTNIQTTMNDLKSGLSTTWENIKTKASESATNISTKVSDAFTTMKKSTSDAFDTLKTKVGGIWEGLKTDIINGGNSVIAKVESFINRVIQGANGLLVKLKNIINRLPDSVIKAASLDRITAAQVEYIKIPRLATGGFPEDGLFMANHGELVGKFSNGKTAVANNQQITDGIEEAAYRGFSRAMSMSNGGNNNGTTTFIAQLNGKTLFEEVVRQNNSSVKTYGLSPLNSF